MRPTLIIVIAAVAGTAFGAIAQGMMGAPNRRAGLWETTMTMSSGGTRAMTVRMCTDPAHDRAHGGIFTGPSQRGAGGGETCSVREFHPIPGGVAFRSVCTNQGTTSSTQGTSTGDYNTHYHVDLTSQSTSPSGGGGTRRMMMDSRWLGPCASGQAPGDMTIVLPGGREMHVGAGMGRPPER